jgi:hypothetical protein
MPRRNDNNNNNNLVDDALPVVFVVVVDESNVHYRTGSVGVDSESVMRVSLTTLWYSQSIRNKSDVDGAVDLRRGIVLWMMTV